MEATVSTKDLKSKLDGRKTSRLSRHSHRSTTAKKANWRCSQCVLRRVKPRPEKEMFGMAHSVTSVRLKRQLRLANRENFSRCALIGLAGILALAFVGGHRNLELAIAKGADSNCRDRPKPFGHPKITLWHGQPCRRQLGGRLSSLRIGTLRLKPWRGRLWWFYSSSVSPC